MDFANDNTDKLVDENGYCFVCGGEGFTDKDCPSCGKKALSKSLSFTKIQPEVFRGKLCSLGVPVSYQGVIWTKDQLLRTHPDLAENPSFAHYVDQLERLHSIFVKGETPNTSVFITSSPGLSKKTFAFSCMQKALSNGFSVAPLIDTMDLKRLLVLSADKPYKLYNKIDIDEYLVSDICFLEVTKLPQHAYAAPVVQELINKRARYGLSTIILSDFSLAEISKYDSSESFSAINAKGFVDNMKYPATIRFFI